MRDYFEIFDYMDSKIDEFIDPMTGEVLVTELAEETAAEFGENMDEDVDQFYYDIAVDVEVKLLGNSFDRY